MDGARRLYGRDDDLVTLVRASSEAARGHGGIVLVTGPAGIGKTTLINELAVRRRAAGDVVLAGRASADPGAPDHWPWTQIITEAWRTIPTDRADEALGPRLRHLAAIVPELTAPAADIIADVDPTGTQFAVYDAALSLLLILADERPTIIVLDDAHHADEGSWRLLELVVRSSVGRRLLIVVASRDLHHDVGPDHEERLARLTGHGRRIGLAGLATGDIEALLTERSGAEVTGDVVDVVQRITGGNPLYVDELSTVVAAGGGVGDLHANSSSLMSATSRLIGTLSLDHRRLLDAAAVLGSTFDERVLAHVAGRPDRDTRLMLTDISRLGPVEPGEIPERWCFRHDVLRDAVLGRLTSDELHDLHGACAESLLASPHGERVRAGAIAAHLVEVARSGGSVGPALQHCRLAGEDAQRRFAHDEAQHWWSEALQLARHDPDVTDAERLELLLELGAAQIKAAHAAAARESFQRARTLAGHIDDPVGGARAAIGYADARFRGPGRETELQDLRGDLEDAVAVLEPAGAQHSLVLARALSHLASCLAGSSEPALARVAAQRATEVAERDGSSPARQVALTAQRHAALGSTALADRSEVTEQLMLLALQNNDPEAEWWAARWRLTDGLEAGDPDRVTHALATTARLADRLLEPELQVHALIYHATVALLEGRFDAMAELHTRARDLATDTDVAMEPVLGQELFASRERGNLDIGGLRFLLEAQPLPIYKALVCWGSANLGRLDDTTADLDRFFDGPALPELPNDVYLLSILAMLTEAVALTGDRERAAALHERLAPYADHGVLAGVGPYVWAGTARHYLCLLTLTMGDLAAAAVHADAALAIHQRMGARPWVLRTQLARAELAVAGGESQRGRPLLEEVAARAQSLSMTAIAAAAESALASLGRAPAGRDECWSLRPDGDAWLLVTPRGTHTLRARKGFGYLQELLRRPSRELHVLDLAGAAGGTVDAGGAGAVLDEAAKEAYRRRVEDLRDQVAEGEAWGDDERVARARTELDAIAHELSSALGLGGRDRRSADGAERARINVTKAIRSTIESVRAVDPDVAAHLSATVRTGTYCAYEPDPASRVTWET